MIDYAEASQFVLRTPTRGFGDMVEDWDDVTRSAYREAWCYARLIVDANNGDVRGPTWFNGILAERSAMCMAISVKMRAISARRGFRPIPFSIVEAAVDAVLEGRGFGI